MSNPSARPRFLSGWRLRQAVPRGLIALAAVAAAVTIAAGPVAAVPGWTTPTQAIAVRFGPPHSLVVDGNGKTHFAVEGGATEGIFYVTNASGAWVETQVTFQSDHTPSLALDPAGNVYIAFMRARACTPAEPCPPDSKGIYFVTDVQGGWDLGVVASGDNYNPSLRFRAGKMRVAYFRQSGPGFHGLVYRTAVPGDPWTSENVSSGCCNSAPSLAFDPAGQPHIVFGRLDNTGLRHAVKSGGVWTIEHVTNGHFDTVPQLAIDGNGDSHVAFGRIGAMQTVRYTTDASGMWVGQHVINTFDNPDIAVTNGGQPRIVVGDGTGIQYLAQGGGVWSQTAISLKATDFGPEIRLGPGGKPRVIFNRASGTTNDGIFFTRKL